MDDPFFSEYLDDFSLVSLVSASEDDNFIIFSDWEGSKAVLLSQVL